MPDQDDLRAAIRSVAKLVSLKHGDQVVTASDELATITGFPINIHGGITGLVALELEGGELTELHVSEIEPIDAVTLLARLVE